MVAVLTDVSFSNDGRRAVRSASSAADLRRAAGLSGDRSARRVAPEVYRRRRLLAAGLFLLAIAAVLVTAQSIWAGTGGGPLSATGAAASRPAVSQIDSAEWVVRPGDTLWSIARSVQPSGDERPLVDKLSAEVGGNLYPGQVIPLPAR